MVTHVQPIERRRMDRNGARGHGRRGGGSGSGRAPSPSARGDEGQFLLAFSRTDETYDQELWQTLAEQGLLGIAVPESAGGTGLGLVELCLVLEEQGRRVAPVPLYASLVLGGLPIAEFGTGQQQQRYLEPLASGTAKFSAAIADLGMNAALASTVNATAQGDGWVLNGDKAAVPDGAAADFILVPAETADGDPVVFIVDAKAEGVSVQPVEIGISGQRAANLSLQNVLVAGDAVGVGVGEHVADVQAARDGGRRRVHQQPPSPILQQQAVPGAPVARVVRRANIAVAPRHRHPEGRSGSEKGQLHDLTASPRACSSWYPGRRTSYPR